MTVRPSLSLGRRLIADAPWAQARLRPYAGHAVSWSLAGLRGAVRIDEDGLPAAPEAAVEASDLGQPTGDSRTERGKDSAEKRPPGVHLHLASADLDALGHGVEALMRKVSIEGNAGLAGELAYIARHLRPDIEEWLAPLLGDALAEQTGRQLRAGATWGAQAAQRAARAAVEYSVHEARLLVDEGVVAEHLRAIDQLREDSDRLQQRVLRLERRLAATPRRTPG